MTTNHTTPLNSSAKARLEYYYDLWADASIIWALVSGFLLFWAIFNAHSIHDKVVTVILLLASVGLLTIYYRSYLDAKRMLDPASHRNALE